jgi:tetratricopeptide (TPR) repeat protein
VRQNEEAEVRYWMAILSMGAALAGAAPGARSAELSAQWAEDGRFHFFACEFKQAARAFENAAAVQPEDAGLHYWLGKSYARLAEVSGPLSASKNARKARRNLEQAVQLDPRNQQYLAELFDFYVDSPEWLGGGLERAAALLERMGPDTFGAQERMAQLAESRKEHRGAGWLVRLAVLRTSSVVGYLVPQRW